MEKIWGVYVYPNATMYSDRTTEVGGDYKRIVTVVYDAGGGRPELIIKSKPSHKTWKPEYQAAIDQATQEYLQLLSVYEDKVNNKTYDARVKAEIPNFCIPNGMSGEITLKYIKKYLKEKGVKVYQKKQRETYANYAYAWELDTRISIDEGYTLSMMVWNNRPVVGEKSKSISIETPDGRKSFYCWQTDEAVLEMVKWFNQLSGNDPKEKEDQPVDKFKLWKAEFDAKSYEHPDVKEIIDSTDESDIRYVLRIYLEHQQTEYFWNKFLVFLENNDLNTISLVNSRLTSLAGSFSAFEQMYRDSDDKEKYQKSLANGYLQNICYDLIDFLKDSSLGKSEETKSNILYPKGTIMYLVKSPNTSSLPTGMEIGDAVILEQDVKEFTLASTDIKVITKERKISGYMAVIGEVQLDQLSEEKPESNKPNPWDLVLPMLEEEKVRLQDIDEEQFSTIVRKYWKFKGGINGAGRFIHKETKMSLLLFGSPSNWTQGIATFYQMAVKKWNSKLSASELSLEQYAIVQFLKGLSEFTILGALDTTEESYRASWEKARGVTTKVDDVSSTILKKDKNEEQITAYTSLFKEFINTQSDPRKVYRILSGVDEDEKAYQTFLFKFLSKFYDESPTTALSKFLNDISTQTGIHDFNLRDFIKENLSGDQFTKKVLSSQEKNEIWRLTIAEFTNQKRLDKIDFLKSYPSKLSLNLGTYRSVNEWISDLEQGNYKLPLDLEEAHELHVKTAINEGKPVPPNVLADYPELNPASKTEFWNEMFKDAENPNSEPPTISEDAQIILNIKETLVNYQQKAQESYDDWNSRAYKKSDGTVWVGNSILDGGNYSYNYINEKRRDERKRSLISYVNAVNIAIDLLDNFGANADKIDTPPKIKKSKLLIDRYNFELAQEMIWKVKTGKELDKLPTPKSDGQKKEVINLEPFFNGNDSDSKLYKYYAGAHEMEYLVPVQNYQKKKKDIISLEQIARHHNINLVYAKRKYIFSPRGDDAAFKAGPNKLSTPMIVVDKKEFLYREFYSYLSLMKSKIKIERKREQEYLDSLVEKKRLKIEDSSLTPTQRGRLEKQLYKNINTQNYGVIPTSQFYKELVHSGHKLIKEEVDGFSFRMENESGVFYRIGKNEATYISEILIPNFKNGKSYLDKDLIQLINDEWVEFVLNNTKQLITWATAYKKSDFFQLVSGELFTLVTEKDQYDFSKFEIKRIDELSSTGETLIKPSNWYDRFKEKTSTTNKNKLPVIENSTQSLDDKKTDIIDHLHNEWRKGNRLTPKPLEALASKFGIEDMDVFYEIAELAWVLWYRKIINKYQRGDIESIYKDAVDFYLKIQPSYNQTSSTKRIYQQYSTAAPISIMGAWYTNAHLSISSVFEPSAGNGLLAVFSKYENTVVNEIDKTRLSNLHYQDFKEVLNQDALEPFVGHEKKYDAVLSNPPFGKLPEVNYDFDGFKISKMDHLMITHALTTMKDDGRAALIIGGHSQYKSDGRMQSHRVFFNWLGSRYYIDDVINIDSRKLYNRQGTAAPLRMILISGRKPQPFGEAPRLTSDTQYLYDYATTFEELQERVNAAKEKADQPKETIRTILQTQIEMMKFEISSTKNNSK